MFQNYLFTVFRNWASHRLFTLINIGGLTVGLTCAVFIMLFVRDELSYDRWIPDSENLYRVEITYNNSGQPPINLAEAPFPMPAAMVDQIPEVTAMTRLIPQVVTVSVDNHQFLERVDVVDPKFFQIVKLPLLEGDPENVFSHPESVVISQSIAKKYFGSETGNVGKSLTISEPTCSNAGCQVQAHTLIITGILRDLPHNTQLAADIVFPNTSGADALPRVVKQNWGSVSGLGYVKLTQDADPEKVLAKLKDIIDRSVRYDMGNDKWRTSEKVVPRLTRFWDAHLTTDRYDGNLTPAGSQTTVYGFVGIGVLILLVACFNFTNLAIAGATLRAREISLRKVMGARRDQIVVQFLAEAVLMALIALALALAITQPLLAPFGRFLNRPIALHYFGDWPILATIAAAAIVAGLLSGLYPALVLSNFKPAVALRNSMAQVTGSGRFRAALVVLQFAVSIGLGIAAVVVFAQISYARHVDLGFRKEDMVVITRLESMPPSNQESFINVLRMYPGIFQATLGGSDVPILSGSIGNNSLARLQGAQSDETFREVMIGPEFTSVYGVRLLAGRALSDKYGEDRLVSGNHPKFNILINASAARRFGLTPDEAIGKAVTFEGGTATIVGVIDDIKMGGPQHETSGIIYCYNPSDVETVSIHIRPGQFSDTLDFIDKTWSAFAPGIAISRYFLDEVFNKQFKADEQQGVVFSLFVGIAIFIACLGLFGLAAFSAERRTKEIGLRKTFGAKAHHIVLLLLWQFSIPVLVANAVAWPVAYYYLHRWLNGYADRISLNPLYFVGAGAAALAIAWATVYVHAHRMARANPINALRYE